MCHLSIGEKNSFRQTENPYEQGVEVGQRITEIDKSSTDRQAAMNCS